MAISAIQWLEMSHEIQRRALVMSAFARRTGGQRPKPLKNPTVIASNDLGEIARTWAPNSSDRHPWWAFADLARRLTRGPACPALFVAVGIHEPQGKKTAREWLYVVPGDNAGRERAHVEAFVGKFSADALRGPAAPFKFTQECLEQDASNAFERSPVDAEVGQPFLANLQPGIELGLKAPWMLTANWRNLPAFSTSFDADNGLQLDITTEQYALRLSKWAQLCVGGPDGKRRAAEILLGSAERSHEAEGLSKQALWVRDLTSWNSPDELGMFITLPLWLPDNRTQAGMNGSISICLRRGAAVSRGKPHAGFLVGLLGALRGSTGLLATGSAVAAGRAAGAASSQSWGAHETKHVLQSDSRLIDGLLASDFRKNPADVLALQLLRHSNHYVQTILRTTSPAIAALTPDTRGIHVDTFLKLAVTQAWSVFYRYFLFNINEAIHDESLHGQFYAGFAFGDVVADTVVSPCAWPILYPQETSIEERARLVELLFNGVVAAIQNAFNHLSGLKGKELTALQRPAALLIYASQLKNREKSLSVAMEHRQGSGAMIVVKNLCDTSLGEPKDTGTKAVLRHIAGELGHGASFAFGPNLVGRTASWVAQLDLPEWRFRDA